MTLAANKNQFIIAYSAAPLAVREAMTSEQTMAVINGIQNTYNLHLDTIGEISKALGYMLLGLIDPSTFYDDLLKLGISKENSSTIVKEVNEQIFIPLQELIKKGEPQASEALDDEPEAEYDAELDSVIATLPATPVQAVQSAAQVPILQIAPNVQLPQPRAARIPAPVAPVAPVPIITETPSYNLVRPDVLVAVPRPVMLHSMQADIEALKNPVVPQTLAPVSTPAMLHPEHLTPARSFQTGSVPFGGNASAQPVFQSASRVAAPAPEILPSRVVVPPASSVPPQQEIVKEYGADPYREPM